MGDGNFSLGDRAVTYIRCNNKFLPKWGGRVIFSARWLEVGCGVRVLEELGTRSFHRGCLGTYRGRLCGEGRVQRLATGGRVQLTAVGSGRVVGDGRLDSFVGSRQDMGGSSVECSIPLTRCGGHVRCDWCVWAASDGSDMGGRHPRRERGDR